MSLLLRGTGSGSPHEPFEFFPQDALALPLRRDLHILTLFLKAYKLGIAAGVTVNFSLIHFHNPGGHTVQEITVMGNHHEGSTETDQKVLEPLGHLTVQMVGGLVQNQDIRLL